MPRVPLTQDYLISVNGLNQNKSNQTKTLRFYKILCCISLLVTSLIIISVLIFNAKVADKKSDKTQKLEKELRLVKQQLLQVQQGIIAPDAGINSSSEKDKEVDKLVTNLKDQLEQAKKKSSLFSPTNLKLIRESDMPFINSLFLDSKIKLIPLYQASTDGDSLPQFKQHLQDVPSLLFVLETTEGLRIGGYVNNICFPYENNRGYIAEQDKKAFLFSITNRRKYPVKNYNQAIYCNDAYLIAFNMDLMIVNNCLSNSSVSEFSKTYISVDDDQKFLELTHGVRNFNIREMEVYKVVII